MERRASISVAIALWGIVAACTAAPAPARLSERVEARAGDPERAPPPAASPTARVASCSELALLPLEDRLGAYLTRDARWAPGQPVLINRDFDFGFAMGLEGVGPGLAAARRISGNSDVAQRLAGVAKVPPEAVRARILSRLGPREKRGASALLERAVRVYGVLFGVESARLQVILEASDARGAPERYVAVTPARSVLAFTEPGALDEAFAAGAVGIAALLSATRTWPPPDRERARCNVGDGAYIEGRRASQEEGSTVLAVTEPRASWLWCPTDALALPGS